MQGFPSPKVAFFSMGFALTEALSIYSGGLGVLAGDFLRSARALSLPVIGIGILWGEGFSRQTIDEEGLPGDHPSTVDRSRLIREDVTVHVTIDDEDIPLSVYRTDAYDNVPLYLLEPARPEHRRITRRLYASDGDDRMAQEIVLGVGGVRVLEALGIHVDYHHFNEGHAVFAGLELLRGAREQLRHLAATADRSVDHDPAMFELARHQVRRKIVFTTHTPIAAGNETHDLATLARLVESLGFSREELFQIGGDPFNMTVAGLRLSCRANAVSRLHAETARRMWRHVRDAAPICYAITNGVDRRVWQDSRIREASHAETSTDTGLLAAHRACKMQLLAEVERRSGARLHPDRLLIGLARRATPYKRGTLILSDEARIGRLLEAGRVQLLFAGKAHPKDGGGMAIIGELVAFARRYPQSVVFLPNYDLDLGRLLTRGCDLWLNTPRRPLEACGTSGMKAAMNGVLNFSVLDGWWPEACIHGENGWALGDDPGFGESFEAQLPSEGDELGAAETGAMPKTDALHAAEMARQAAVQARESAVDRRDADALYRELEEAIIPAYEERGARWFGMMRASIALAERFSSDRMVRDYFRRLYVSDSSPRPVLAHDATLQETGGG
jgi:starch phosphorylase